MLDATAARQVEMQILPHAKNLTTGQLPRIVERAVIAADPGSANARHERERVARDVTVRPLDDGMSLLEAYLCAEEAAAARRALDQIADRAGRDDPRTNGQRRADALMSLILETSAQSDEVALSTSGDRLSRVARPLVQLVVSAETMSGSSDAPAELVGHCPVPVDVARRLAPTRPGSASSPTRSPAELSTSDGPAIARRPPWSTTSGPAIRSAPFRRAASPRPTATSITTFPIAGTAPRQPTI